MQKVERAALKELLKDYKYVVDQRNQLLDSQEAQVLQVIVYYKQFYFYKTRNY